MACQKVGSGIYGGNNSCDPDGSKAIAAKMAASGQNITYENGVPYHTTELNFKNSMPIPILAAVGAISQGLTAANTSAAESGKVYTAPKTVAGKLLGRITGRTQAAEISDSMKAATSQAPVGGAVAKNLAGQGFPIGGAITFGSGSDQTTLPFNVLALIAGTFVAIFYFFSKNKRGKRRR